MKTAIKTVCVALAFSLTAGCTSMNQQSGKEETDTLKTVGAGAGIGAAIGAVIGGKRGAVIGAGLGAGAGYLVALENRKKELAEAKQAAAEFKESTGIAANVRPAVYVTNGQQVEGLKSVDVTVPAAAIKGDGLSAKGKDTFAKLSAMSAKTGSTLEVAVPRSTPQGVIADITASAPGAKIVVADGRQVVASLKAKPVTEPGMTVARA